MGNNAEISEKDIKIISVDGKCGYQYPDGTWLAEPEFDKAYELEDGYAKVVKEGLEGWISFDGESAYCPWSPQERWLREYKRKRDRRYKILKKIGLGPKPLNTDWWDEDDHCRLVNWLHERWENFKENPVIPVTILFAIPILIYTFFFD